MSLKIYRRLQSQPETANQLIATLPDDDTTFSDSDLSPATPYAYTYQREAAGKVYEAVTLHVSTLAITITDNVFVSFDGHSMLTRFAATSVGSVPEILAGMGLPYSDFTSYAVAGQTAVAMLNDANTQIYPARKTTGKAHVLVLWPAINDLAAVGANVATIVNTVRTYIEGAIAAGYAVVLFTETSARGASYAARHAAIETLRLEYNQLIRENWQEWGVSYLVDLADDYRIGGYNSGLDTTYFTDGIHMNFKGRTIVSNMAKPAIVGAGKGKTGRITGDRPMAGFLGDESTGITFVGNWGNVTLPESYEAINNNHRICKDANASFSYTANTTKFRLKSVGLPNGAAFKVTVDGVAAGGGTCYEEIESPSKVVWESGTLASGSHTVVVTIDQSVTGADSYLCFDAICYLVSANVTAPDTGSLAVDDNNAAFYVVAGTWARSSILTTYYLGDGRGTITTSPGAVRKINVTARYIDFFTPSIIGAGVLEMTVTRIVDGVIMGVKTWDHNAAGVDRRSGYPDDNTPQLSFDCGAVSDYEISIRNLGGGNNAIAIDQVRIRKV